MGRITTPDFLQNAFPDASINIVGTAWLTLHYQDGKKRFSVSFSRTTFDNAANNSKADQQIIIKRVQKAIGF